MVPQCQKCSQKSCSFYARTVQERSFVLFCFPPLNSGRKQPNGILSLKSYSNINWMEPKLPEKQGALHQFCAFQPFESSSAEKNCQGSELLSYTLCNHSTPSHSWGANQKWQNLNNSWKTQILFVVFAFFQVYFQVSCVRGLSVPPSL